MQPSFNRPLGGSQQEKNGAGVPVAYPALKRGASITASLSQSLGTSLPGRTRVHSFRDVGNDKGVSPRKPKPLTTLAPKGRKKIVFRKVLSPRWGLAPSNFRFRGLTGLLLN